MKILKKSLLHAVLLFVTIFIISSTFILYFSQGEAGSISEISYWSFWIALPFSIFMLFSNYFILNNLENKKSFWKRFLILIGVVVILSLIMYLTTTIGETELEQLGFALLFFIYMPLIFLIISFLLTLLYKFLFRYNEKIIIYMLGGLIAILILAIIINLFMQGGCLSGDTNCYSKKAIEENNINICKDSYPGTICERNFFMAQEDETICTSLIDEKSKGIYLRSECYSYFAEKKNDPSLCRFDDRTREGCCSSIFNVDLYEEGLSEEQKSTCGIQ
ncbi:hypothetical protein J4221_07580 [Candidatus Pacearchaeota archaeon]|nr:hypothetical protein [Candidatus Pacearchaeota archaeon]